MVKAKLEMESSTAIREVCWDNLILLINRSDAVVPFIVIRNRKSAVDLFPLLEAALNEVPGVMEFEIEGQKFTLSEEAREIVAGLVIGFIYEDTVY